MEALLAFRKGANHWDPQLLATPANLSGGYWKARYQELSVPKSVLIVDDHEAVRRELRRLFSSQPEFVVCGEAADGAEAISKAEELGPDLIILDLAMPEMNGLEAATALRFMLPDATLFLLTAYKNRELELAAFQSGVRAVFSKYDDMDGLLTSACSELGVAPRSDRHSRERTQESPENPKS
jgi:DNA-binding NarL/FixJ family response regulator